MSWFRARLLRFILLLDCECPSRVIVFMSFVHCFPFLRFANYPVYKFNISLFKRKNSSHFKFVFQLRQPNEKNQGAAAVSHLGYFCK